MRYSLIILFFPVGLFAQTLVEDIKMLADLGGNIMLEKKMEDRLEASDAFSDLLMDVLDNSNDAFEEDFSEVKNLSVLLSPDKNLRIFSWMIPDVPGKQQFRGMLIVRKKKNDFARYVFTDAFESLINPEYMMMKPDRWYGALYYQIFEVKEKRETYYMLMGYRPLDENVQQKIIDVIHIAKDGIPRFGAKIFETPKLMDRIYERPPHRLFFNYSARVSASFKYMEKEDMIVLDHLAPPEGFPLRQWMHYGPDFSYDGLVFEKGKWKLEEGVTFDSGLKEKLPDKAPKKDPRTGKVILPK
ncbi:MAG: hypothetical protein JJU02_10550 [Cryomorphaceae bacterium]|nr:hypothetical protein [Cryomorphaceae bacterium]